MRRPQTDRCLLEAAQEVVMLHLEDVLLLGELVHLEAALLGRQPRLSRLLLGHERRTRRRLGDSDAGEAGLLRWWASENSIRKRQWIRTLFHNGYQ